MAINSRNKGKVGEREWAKFCIAEGFEKARRTAQYCGNSGEASDVVGLPKIHQEVKRVEKLNIEDAMSQSIRDSLQEGNGSLPIVAHRKNNCKWLVTMRAEDWFKLYREFLDSTEV